MHCKWFNFLKFRNGILVSVTLYFDCSYRRQKRCINLLFRQRERKGSKITCREWATEKEMNLQHQLLHSSTKHNMALVGSNHNPPECVKQSPMCRQPVQNQCTISCSIYNLTHIMSFLCRGAQFWDKSSSYIAWAHVKYFHQSVLNTLFCFSCYWVNPKV